jgi:hypothetical protein
MENALEEARLPSQDQFDSWIGSLPAHVADVVRAHSPFVPHRLKETGHTVFIARFEAVPDEEKVRLSVVAPQSANPSQGADLTFEVDPDDIFPLAS